MFELLMSVRDYECDMQSIVNNSVYMNYLEHARHEFLKSINLDFAALTQAGINLVVVRAELDYKSPLKSGNHFTVSVQLEQISKLRFAFNQTIKTTEGKLILQAKVTGTSINEKGRPQFPSKLLAVFEQNS
ncbi:acyl-CoA thioesterase [Catenovulum adriaticum]|uniref:Acyl-CoA thioesterase n=1 Tax=Catenovulum adriaticum TaxID=2984846 RepID=A0ABY7AR99_9ALTE|nr:acyl-CoA thioesterase [Catenovulum sp. TS8]WAJ71292.1 acyl-CoA thioesterase [Catenovulum sp. TS8]